MLNLEFNFGLVFEKFLLQEDFENQLSEAEDVFRWDTVDYKSKAIVNRIAQKPQNHMAVISICFRYRIEEYNKRDMEQSELLNAFEHLALLVASAFVAFPQLAMVQDAHLLCNGCHYYMGTKESIYWPGGFLIEAPNGEQWKTTLSWMVLADQNPKLKFIPLFRNAIFLELYEQLHTAVSALEQAYVPEEKCIRERLKNRIPRIVPTADGERIKEMYSFRSEYVHGNVIAPYALVRDWVWFDPTVATHGQYAMELLRATLRVLIENDASNVKFKDEKYTFIQQKRRH